MTDERFDNIGFVFNNRDRDQTHEISVGISARMQRKNRA